MIKILFICHGNICRSPMAEFFMKDIVAKRGISEEFFIASAATSREEIGNPIYPPVRRIIDAKGIDYRGKTAIQVTKADYEKYDYLICMDSNNVRNLLRIVNDDKDKKIFKLLDFTNYGGDVADPWYTGDFSSTEHDVEAGCEGLLQHILDSKQI